MQSESQEQGDQVDVSTDGSAAVRVRPRGVAKLAWLAAGWTFFGIGVLGVALPGLPTTGPMLLAVACFARGSDRLHDWLMNHRVFGPPLREWQENRTMPLRAKITALVMMTGSFTYIVFFAPMPLWLVAAIALLIVVGMVVVSRIPHRARPCPYAEELKMLAGEGEAASRAR